MLVRNMSPEPTRVAGTPPSRRQGNGSQRDLPQSSIGRDTAPRNASLAENLLMTLKLLVIGGGLGLLIWLLDTISLR